MKIEEVNEPIQPDIKECPRCQQECCTECIDFHEVDFDVEDDNEDGSWKEHQWNGEDVCPWCYNQLLRLSQQERRRE